ncbi:MAG TPA: CofH family radical SAM protein [Spirochaetota bacterium]|nr:CofH family radical SAM protein [Spirochaetota bacterium]
MREYENLKKKIISGDRIDSSDAVKLFSLPMPELGALADRRRRMIKDDDTVGFIRDRIVNFTNICEAKCKFCAFHARGGVIPPYEMTIDEILKKIGELNDTGGTQVMLQGGLHPEYKIEKYENMLRAVKSAFPSVFLHSLSPSEVVHMAKVSGVTVDKAVARLKEAGLDSIPGASDLLVDRIRNIVSPKKSTKEEWCSVIRALAKNGMGSTATMTYGMGESIEEKVEHFSVVRSIQDETGILRAFIPWSFSPENTGMDDIPRATGIEYLKIVAVARIFLDNIKHIHAGWLTEGMKPAQLALSMGADDMGGVIMEEVVVRAAGINTTTDMEEMIRLIKDAGKIPVLRDSLYREIERF